MIDFTTVAQAVGKAEQGIQHMLFSPQVWEALGTIAEQHQLYEEQTFQMMDEVGYILLGLKDRKTFLDTLAKIGIEKSAATAIATGVEQHIFSELGATPQAPTPPPTAQPPIQNPPPAPHPPPAPPMPAPLPSAPEPPPVWHHHVENPLPPSTAPQGPLMPPPSVPPAPPAQPVPPIIPPPSNLPTYQRPLTQMPPAGSYRNANLYQKPPQ